MQQRRVRLGDVLDDYCPRERRITNHAVVAMIDDEVKQTRCATCDAEHEYKEAKVPAARRKKGAGVLSADLAEGIVRPRAASAPPEPVFEDESVESDVADVFIAPEPSAVESSPVEVSPVEAAPADDPDANAPDDPHQDVWVHRPLIRATLPRQEGQVPERKAPDFTVRQPGGRFDDRNGQRPRGPRQGRPGQGGGRQSQGQDSRFGPPRGQSPRHGAGPQGQGQRQGSGPGQRHGSNQSRTGTGPGQGNRPGPAAGQRGSRPGGENRGPRPGGPGRKRGR